MNNRDKVLKLISNLEKSLGKTLSNQRKADIEYGYLMACQEQIDEKNIVINKAWKWIDNKVELSYTDYDSYLKAMEE